MIRANYKIPRGMGRGLIQRDMSKAPLGSSAPMFSRPLIPKIRVGRQDRREEKTPGDAVRYPQHQRAKRWHDARTQSGPRSVVLGIQPNECGDTCQGVGRIAVQASQRQRGRQHGHGVQSAWRMVRKRMKFVQEKGVPETSHTGQRATINGIGTAPTPGRTRRKTSSANGGTSIPTTPLQS
jgi:hypothetical protein